MPGTLSIEPLTEDRLEEAVDLVMRVFGPAFEKEAREELPWSLRANPDSRITFVACLDGKMVGMIQPMVSYIHTDTYGLSWVSTDPAHQGKGIGKALVSHAEEHISHDLLKGRPGTIVIVDYTQKENPASRFYASLGYVAGPRTHNGAPVMVKILNM